MEQGETFKPVLKAQADQPIRPTDAIFTAGEAMPVTRAKGYNDRSSLPERFQTPTVKVPIMTGL